VSVEGYEQGMPDPVLNPKKKIWEKLSVDLKTSADGLGEKYFSFVQCCKTGFFASQCF